jgi:hypothetical protein
MSDETSLDELPERDYKDHIRDVVVLGASIVPLPISDFLDRFLPSSLAKRQQEWQQRVAEGLIALQEQLHIMPETLTKNPVFTTALIEATWIAMRHHQEEQLEYLRNMVLNSALPDSPHDSVQKIFFRMVSNFTPSHIKLLEFFSKPDWPSKLGYVSEVGMAGDLYERIASVFPGLHNQVGLVGLIVEDLITNRLLSTGPRGLETNTPYNGLLRTIFTDFGGSFLEFVKSPVEKN